MDYKILKNELEKLLNETADRLNVNAKKGHYDVSKLTGKDLEPFIASEIRKIAKGTIFEDKIVEIGGQKFPDLVIFERFGIEVKSTTQNHWITTGNSVLESTRVEGVDEIWIFFGKLGDVIEFKVRKYEDCLSEVVVTHSPRYLINMNLSEGESIFHKMKSDYDSVRLANPPLSPVLNYYRSKLKPGEQIWYLGTNNSTSIVTRFWSSIPSAERKSLIVMAFTFFPEIFNRKRLDKFNNYTAWMVQCHSVVCNNIRDVFSAGGKKTIIVNGIVYNHLPRILVNLVQNYLPEILDLISNTDTETLSKKWNIDKIENDSKIEIWIKIIHGEFNSSKPYFDLSNLLINKISEINR